jgi:Ser/Thr protein kinase RdoA (MazF antagonist)
MSEEEANRKLEKPPEVAADAAEAFLREQYGLAMVASSFKELNSYDDRNFYFRAATIVPTKKLQEIEIESTNKTRKNADEAGNVDIEGVQKKVEEPVEYLLKVHNGVDSQNAPFVQAQNLVLAHLDANQLPCPRVISALNGSKITWLSLERASNIGPGLGSESKVTRKHAVRVLTYIPGTLMANISQTPTLIEHVGGCIGRMDAVLQSFEHQALHRVHMWDLANTSSLRDFVKCIPTDCR